MRIESLAIEDLKRIKRYKADHGGQAKLTELAIGETQHVIKETVLLVPQLVITAAHLFHSCADVDEVLEKLGGKVFVGAIEIGQFEGGTHQIKTEETHPAGGVRLLENGAVRQSFTAVHHRDVVQT